MYINSMFSSWTNIVVNVSPGMTRFPRGCILMVTVSPTVLKFSTLAPTCEGASRCFEKNFMRSFFYMLRDMACVLALQYLYPHYVAGNWALTFVWWNLTGFMLWALFVVGEQGEQNTWETPSCIVIINIVELCSHLHTHTHQSQAISDTLQ